MLDLCDRIIVMRQGRVDSRERSASDNHDKAELSALIAGSGPFVARTTRWLLRSTCTGRLCTGRRLEAVPLTELTEEVLCAARILSATPRHGGRQPRAPPWPGKCLASLVAMARDARASLRTLWGDRQLTGRTHCESAEKSIRNNEPARRDRGGDRELAGRTRVGRHLPGMSVAAKRDAAVIVAFRRSRSASVNGANAEIAEVSRSVEASRSATAVEGAAHAKDSERSAAAISRR